MSSKWLAAFLFLAALLARTISRKELLKAIRESPEIYRYRNGELRVDIRGAENRKRRIRSNFNETLPDSVICAVRKTPFIYTRFNTCPELQLNLLEFKKAYKKSAYRKLKDHFSTLTELELNEIALRIVPELLQMIAFVLPEDDKSKSAKAYLAKQRSVLAFLTENVVFMTFIKQNDRLCRLAMQAIEAHLFANLNPVNIDFTLVEPEDIQDLGFGTMCHIYTLLTSIISESDPESAAFKIIEESAALVPKLFQLLYLPDARERKCAEVVLINLFHRHPSFQKSMVGLLRYKYMEMELYSHDYAFIYHDILAIHRGFYMMAKSLKEGERNLKLIELLEGMFLNQAIPLIASSDLTDFSGQWTFLMLEIAPSQNEALEVFTKYAFSTGNLHSNYNRDSETMRILDNILENIPPTGKEWQLILRFLFQKTTSLAIRPSHQEEFLERFVLEDSFAWKCFNVENGTMMKEFQAFPLAIYEINRGLRLMFISCYRNEIDIPEFLFDAIELWMPSFEFWTTLMTEDVGMFQEEGEELDAINMIFEEVKKFYM